MSAVIASAVIASEAKQSRFTCPESAPEIASSGYALLAMTQLEEPFYA
jgi:hypothetical protein